MKNISKLAGILLTYCVLAGLSAYAQPSAPTATQQAQNFQNNMEMQKPFLTLYPGTNAPETYQGENADIGEQHILRLLPRSTLFMVSLDSEYLYTDNALLTTANPVSSTEFVNTLVAAFAPTPFRMGPGRFAPEFGYTGQWFDYGLGGNSKLSGATPPTPIDSIDFNVQSAFGGAKYYLPDNWILYGQVNYNWYFQQNSTASSPSGRMFYRELVPDLEVERLIQVTHRAVLGLTAAGDWHESWQINDPHDLQNRADGLLSVFLTYQVTPKLIVQPYYRFQYSYYPKDSSGGPVRQDLLNSFGGSVTWFFTPNLSFRVFANDDIEHVRSDSFAPDYHDWNVGADLAYVFRF